MNEWILNQLKDNPAVKEMNQGSISSTSLIEEALVISANYAQKKRPIVIVKNNAYAAQRLFERMNTLLSKDECALFTVEESLRVEAIVQSKENVANKVETLASLIQNPNQVIVTHAAAIVRQLPQVEVFKDRCIHLEVDQEITMNELKEKLIESGYYQVSHIDQPLSFAQRGGIIDIYSMNYDLPIRVEFFDTVVDSIRFFSIETQKTVEQVSSVDCIPASDILFSEEDINTIESRARALLKERYDAGLESIVDMDMEYLHSHIIESNLYSYFSFLDKTSSLLDYMDNPLVILSSKETVEESYKHFMDESIQYVQEMVQEHKMLPKFSIMHDLHRVLDKRKWIEADPYADNISKIQEVHLPKETIKILISIIQKQYSANRILMCLKDSEIKSVIEACVEEEIPYTFIQGPEDISDGINIAFESLFEGFYAEQEKLLVVTSTELFEVKAQLTRYAKKFKNAEVLHSYQDLQPKDYVVHNQHGVGQYMGIETRVIQGIHKDFLRVIYKGNAELLVPLEQFKLVRKFVSREGIVPKLNKLGTDEWTKTKERLKENVEQLAERLVSLYSVREKNIGYQYHEDNEYQKEFEDAFEYELTSDQAIAVDEVKKDMMSDRPMDRLLCGDVGFGKTEVAIRASFKAVGEGKQVAFLCPTTILAEQHFKTYSKRFKDYPVNIRVLNRFVTGKAQTETLRGLKEGTVDIVIGTHRLLSKDVKFKDLGLLIIDEEQRFGVEHKEKIKELKASVDVLSLSATPIPRTLQMSLVGIRQLSQLETPPDNRYSVQTYVVEKNNGLIQEVIQRELSRKGQVFYLYNNVEQIYNVARKIQGMIPEARVGIAHGQMGKEEIESVMLQFTNKELDVLVCTTIIETGIDIPNANTILIENAQNFGLSQLYQIKGRVGRSDRVAYAYLMIPERKQVNEIAQKRLQAIKEFAQLGSGYKIAMRDLTIRGAGDLLGPSQSGFIDTVGIDMYIEMLEEAINEKKGIVKEETQETRKPNVKVDSYIPEKFAPDDFDKISMYQTIDKIENVEELNQYKTEIVDEYGKLPKAVEILFQKKRLEILINDENVERYREIKGQGEITFSPLFSSKVDGVKLFEIFTTISKDITIKYQDGKIIAHLPKVLDVLPLAIEVLSRSKEAIKSES